MNVSDLQTVLGLSYSTNNSTLSENKEVDYNQHGRLVNLQVACLILRVLSVLTSFLRSRSEAQDEQTTQHGEPGADEAHSRQDECKSFSLVALSY